MRKDKTNDATAEKVVRWSEGWAYWKRGEEWIAAPLFDTGAVNYANSIPVTSFQWDARRIDALVASLEAGVGDRREAHRRGADRHLLVTLLAAAEDPEDPLFFGDAIQGIEEALGIVDHPSYAALDFWTEERNTFWRGADRQHREHIASTFFDYLLTFRRDDEREADRDEAWAYDPLQDVPDPIPDEALEHDPVLELSKALKAEAERHATTLAHLEAMVRHYRPPFGRHVQAPDVVKAAWIFASGAPDDIHFGEWLLDADNLGKLHGLYELDRKTADSIDMADSFKGWV